MNDDHEGQLEPRLALVESNREPITLPRPRTLRTPDHRETCRAVAASWWRQTCESYPQGGAGVARWMGADRPTVHRYGTAEKLLPFGDVLAAPPDVAGRMLRAGLDRIERQPVRGEGRLVAEAIRACAEAAQLAARLEACAPEAMQAGTREDLAAWAERLALKLWRIARRLREGG